ncbi:hypothetical protein N7463_005910 [Penicillium fimorum]|uniref:Uncharacterized protein n=1 Tax=Penicillium fimorum TaxID=1882269 RepID=A0A9W9XUC5_9EURO|nr:hypothetical protein N7463_005910 [Penicillium fimorum]
MPHIILLGTLDTKRAEILYLYTELQQNATCFSKPLQITLIDCGRLAIADDAITISHTDLLAKYASGDSTEILTLPRGQVIELLISCVSRRVADLLRTTDIHGIIGAGGSGGTSLISAVMRTAAPIGLPKLIVSTVASGNTGPVVGECDITLMYSVVDIAGINRLLREVLGNAAGAMFGMASTYQHRLNESRTLKVYVFHTTGHGGKAMERLVEEGRLDAILDITATEICDLIAGGTMRCEFSRLETTLNRGIPNIISVGATDMINFGPVDTIPHQFPECREVGGFILDKLGRFTQASGMVEVWLPGGVSSIGIIGSAFTDADADTALADTLRSGLKDGKIRVVSDERDINDDGFALDIADRLMALVAKHSSS